jgi:ABC-type antimicrobial peptide transport system permease subunit
MVSGAVSQRRGELAVRLALGATHDRLLRLVVGEGALLVAIGILIAGPGVYAAGRLLRGLLIGVSPLDPLALAAAAAGLSIVTLCACYVPARRVLRIDPSPLLRE